MSKSWENLDPSDENVLTDDEYFEWEAMQDVEDDEEYNVSRFLMRD